MRLAGALPDTATRLGAGLDFCRPRSKPMFAGVYRAGTGGFLLWDGNWASFQAKWQDASHQGLRLVDLSCYQRCGGHLGGRRRRYTRRHAGLEVTGCDGVECWAGPCSA